MGEEGEEEVVAPAYGGVLRVVSGLCWVTLLQCRFLQHFERHSPPFFLLSYPILSLLFVYRMEGQPITSVAQMRANEGIEGERVGVGRLRSTENGCGGESEGEGAKEAIAME